MRLPTRRTLWLSAVLLLVVNIGAIWLFAPRSRITQANFDRIQDGMNMEEAMTILGEHARYTEFNRESPDQEVYGMLTWRNGASRIRVTFKNGNVFDKDLDSATAWETVRWYARKGAEKIGVKWD